MNVFNLQSGIHSSGKKNCAIIPILIAKSIFRSNELQTNIIQFKLYIYFVVYLFYLLKEQLDTYLYIIFGFEHFLFENVTYFLRRNFQVLC